MPFLTSCHSERIVYQPIDIPGAYLDHCIINYGDKSVGDTIEGLSAGVLCERSGKDAIRGLIEKAKNQ